MQKGIKNGTLWGLIILLLYTWAFFVIGYFFIWDQARPEDFLGWLKIGFTSIGFLIMWILGEAIVLAISIYFIAKDPDAKQTFKKNWPLIFAGVYTILPDPIPGPIDDAIVIVIAAGIKGWGISRIRKMDKSLDAQGLIANESELLESRTSKEKISTHQTIADAEFVKIGDSEE